MASPKNPLTGVEELAQRLLDDAEALVKAAGESSVKILNEGIGLTHDAVQVPLDAIALAHNQLGHAANKLRDLRVSAPAAEDDETKPAEIDPPVVAPGVNPPLH